MSSLLEMRTVTSELTGQKILDVISDYSNREAKGGITPLDITRELNRKKRKIEDRIHKRTVRRYLASLRAEGIIERRKGIGHRREYCVTRVYLQSQPFFVYHMRRIGRRMIYPIWATPNVIASSKPTDPIPTSGYGLTGPENEFYEQMCSNDVTISSKYCQTKFSRTGAKEKYMFEFVNRIGAFITHIFIESLKVLRNKEKEKSRSDIDRWEFANFITKPIIDNAIDLQSFFRELGHLFQIPITSNYIGLAEEDIQEISSAFRKVYPAGMILEKYWLDTLELSRKFKEEQARKNH